MLQLFPNNKNKEQSQPENNDSSVPRLILSTHFKRNSLLNIGFQANDEDNIGRKKKVRQFLEEFNSKLDVIRKTESPLSIKDKIREHSEPLYAILDQIFNVYNINIQIISQDQSDSAIRIEPTMNLGKAVQCLVSVAIVLSKFPYSFIKLIDLNKFTVCKKAQLKNSVYEELFTNRILTNSMFMLDVHDTYEKIENFFYRVVLFHAKKKLPTIHTEWPVDMSPRYNDRSKTKFFGQISSQNISPRNRSPIIKGSPTLKGSAGLKAKSLSDDLKQKEEHEIFCKIMTNPKLAFDDSNMKVQIRALFLKEKLETIDPIGIYKTWWDELLDNTVVLCDKVDDFSLKF